MRYKQLKKGKTLIKSGITAPINGQNCDLEIYYGNVCKAYIGGEEYNPSGKMSLPESTYKSLLDAFLESTAGSEYMYPEQETVSVNITPGSVAEKEPEPEPEPVKEEPVPALAAPVQKEETPIETEPADEEDEELEEQPAEVKKEKKKQKQLKLGREKKKKEKQAENRVAVSEEAVQSVLIKRNKLLTTLLTVASLLAVAGFLLAAEIIPNPLKKANITTYEVIEVAKDLDVGDVIEESDLAATTITEAEYHELSSGTVIDGNGVTRKSYVELWSNRSSVVGTYVQDELSTGDLLVNTDYGYTKNGYVVVDIDGEKTKIPVTSTTAGDTSVRIYAIVSTKTNNDTRVIAIPLSTMTLEGRDLTEIFNGSGQSILSLIDQNSTTKDAESETKDSDSTMKESTNPYSTENTESSVESSGEGSDKK